MIRSISVRKKPVIAADSARSVRPAFVSIMALNYLANGYRKLWLDFTELMRSYTSVYQLGGLIREYGIAA